MHVTRHVHGNLTAWWVGRTVTASPVGPYPLVQLFCSRVIVETCVDRGWREASRSHPTWEPIGMHRYDGKCHNEAPMDRPHNQSVSVSVLDYETMKVAQIPTRFT